MTFEAAVRATEVLLALALIQQSVEHLVWARRDAWLFGARIVLCIVLLSGGLTGLALIALLGLNCIILYRFQGPYNGGSDRMGGLILFCLTLTQLMPDPHWQERVFGYLGIQLVLSYFISGKVKLCNRDWRNGRALSDVFAFSAYPVSQDLRALSGRTRLLWAASWAVILFEVFFPLALMSQVTLVVALGSAPGSCGHGWPPIRRWCGYKSGLWESDGLISAMSKLKDAETVGGQSRRHLGAFARGGDKRPGCERCSGRRKRLGLKR
ncbi:hypothetical protein GQR58_002058 [Nymphon striatum]|nr:hypothetical protein GQR58_002058 [Nymphon striatum]